ncbi:MAG: hypothetical protein JWM02_1329 [Frankiales bacterium]|nr:hypothetical protein [Frankiales bacterium]
MTRRGGQQPYSVHPVDNGLTWLINDRFRALFESSNGRETRRSIEPSCPFADAAFVWAALVVPFIFVAALVRASLEGLGIGPGSGDTAFLVLVALPVALLALSVISAAATAREDVESAISVQFELAVTAATIIGVVLARLLV